MPEAPWTYLFGGLDVLGGLQDAALSEEARKANIAAAVRNRLDVEALRSYALPQQYQIARGAGQQYANQANAFARAWENQMLGRAGGSLGLPSVSSAFIPRYDPAALRGAGAAELRPGYAYAPAYEGDLFQKMYLAAIGAGEAAESGTPREEIASQSLAGRPSLAEWLFGPQSLWGQLLPFAAYRPPEGTSGSPAYSLTEQFPKQSAAPSRPKKKRPGRVY
jgi:hypothetical protein